MYRILILAACLLCASAVHAEGYIKRLLDHPVPGGVAVVDLGTGTAAPRAVFDGRRAMVLRDSDDRWIAVVGIDLKTRPGRAHLKVIEPSGERELAFTVASRTYREQHIRLKNKSHVHPSPAQLERYEREFREQTEAYARFRESGPSNISLDKPVHGRLSSPFGLRRFFNGEERNPHSGLDFAVGMGTPVRAPADGVVTIVGDYFFNGRTVFLDHGQGFITMYCHLSHIDVEKGRNVKRGEIIARTGATGRATGPHLHWNVSLNGVRVDPTIFIGEFKP